MVVIKEIVIGAPHVTYEVGGDAGSNIDALKENANAFMAKHGGGAKGAAGSTDSSDSTGSETAGGDKRAAKDEKKLIIENLYIRGGEVSVSATMLEGITLTAPLPDIHLKDIGKQAGGASPAEVANEILTAITDASTAAVASLGVEGLIGCTGKAVEGAVEEATEAIEKAVGSGAGEAVEEGLGEAKKALEGLLGD